MDDKEKSGSCSFKELSTLITQAQKLVTYLDELLASLADHDESDDDKLFDTTPVPKRKS